MAREEHDRENLLRDATAFVERIELAQSDDSPASGHPIFIGFRESGAASVYFGTDPVYHFNSRSQLRRAFCDGLLLKAEHGRLVSLRRVRQADEVQLLRRELPHDEAAMILTGVRQRMQELKFVCDRKSFTIVGQMPEDIDVLTHVVDWLGQCDDVQIADAPHTR